MEQGGETSGVVDNEWSKWCDWSVSGVECGASGVDEE